MFTIPPQIKGLIFDCDGTLADTMPLHLKCWQEAMSEMGGNITAEEFWEYAGVPTMKIIQNLNQRHGYNIDPLKGCELKEKYYVGMVHDIQPIAEVVAVVEAYRGRLPMAVATGGQLAVVKETLRTIHLADAFQHIVTADDVEHAKPAPDIFLESARRLGVAPTDCLVFEDADAGIEGATAAGMMSIDIRKYPVKAFEGRG